MKTLPILLTVIGLLAVGPFSPQEAWAGARHHHHGHHRGGVVVVSPVVVGPVIAHPFFPRPFFSPLFVRPFVPFGVVTSTVVVYNPPPVVYPPPPVVYAPPPGAYYAAPAVAPAPPPMPTVIQYPHGRYELRGDGVTTPYTWVWIPNPPPPPPPPATPPAEPHSMPAPAPAPGQIYSWTDAQGVTTWTNRVDKTPDGARAPAKRVQAAGI